MQSRLLRRGALLIVCAVLLAALSFWAGVYINSADAQAPRSIGWGDRGEEVRAVQSRLAQWGYFNGTVDGVFGAETYRAVVLFQQRNGLWPADGIVGPAVYDALGMPRNVAPSTGAAPAAQINRSDDLELLARVVAAEAEGEPFEGQVAVAAVILNRVRDPAFPNSLSGVIYQPHAFESVSNGLIWRRTPSQEAYSAAEGALNGWDPTYGSVFFWNPSKPVTPWIWSRSIIVRIGSHVFAV